MRHGPESSVVNGVDTYTFPTVIPEGITVIDNHSIIRVPEQLLPIMTDLLGELAQAQPDGLGRRSACVLVGHDRGYGGYSVNDVVDSFPMALDKVPEGKFLYGAMSLAIGSKSKEKNAMPSGADFDRLVPLLTANAKFCILQPNDWDMCRILPAATIAPRYESGEVEELMGQTKLAAQKELIQLTMLSPRECEFLAELRFAGRDAGVRYHLMGSGVGFKGQSAALHPGMNEDLDIIAVSDRDQVEIVASFEAMASEFYGSLTRKHKVVRMLGARRVVEGYVYSGKDNGIRIDFFAGNTL